GGRYLRLVLPHCRALAPFLLVLSLRGPCCQKIQNESKGRRGRKCGRNKLQGRRCYLLFSKSMVTCFCNVSYSTSFSFLSNLASFSLLAFLLELLGFQSSFFSFFVFGVLSALSTNFVLLFLLFGS